MTQGEVSDSPERDGGVETVTERPFEPAFWQGFVSRKATIEAARSGPRVVGVTAPAGYGKSTLLAEWAQIEDRRSAWVSLGRYDDDPSTFLALMVGAAREVTRANSTLDAITRGTPPLGSAAPRLAAAFASAPYPFVLFVDDLHHITSPECHDVLGVALRGIPTGSQFVAASRSPQPHLAWLRASGDAVEVTAEDLAFNTDEASSIFAAAAIELSVAEADRVTRRAEGWPVGIHLAALIAAEGGDLAGDDRYVADYLYQQVLAGQDEKLQTFLRRTAVLDQLSGPLCDAVLGTARSGQTLCDLEDAGMFVVPLDRRRVWFRYHDLFREFLLAELQREEPTVREDLHERAASWFLANEMPERALEHLLLLPDHSASAQLATQLAVPMYASGRLSTLERWLDTLGDVAVEDHPPLGVMAGWAAALTGEQSIAARRLAQAEEASFEGDPGDGSATFDSARAMLRALLCQEGPQRMLADASLALSLEPGWSPWRDTALWEAGEAHLMLGDRAETLASFRESIRQAHECGIPDCIVIGHAQCALLSMEEGDWESARQDVRASSQALTDNHMQDYVLGLLCRIAEARLALHDGDKAQALEKATRVMHRRTATTEALPYNAVRVRVELARVMVALGEVVAAGHLLAEAESIRSRRPHIGVLGEQLDQARGSLKKTRTRQSQVAALSPAELRVVPYLQTHLTFVEIAERLYLSPNTIRTHVRAIYRKIGVSSRSDAVLRAAEIGLIGGQPAAGLG